MGTTPGVVPFLLGEAVRSARRAFGRSSHHASPAQSVHRTDLPVGTRRRLRRDPDAVLRLRRGSGSEAVVREWSSRSLAKAIGLTVVPRPAALPYVRLPAPRRLRPSCARRLGPCPGLSHGRDGAGLPRIRKGRPKTAPERGRRPAPRPPPPTVRRDRAISRGMGRSLGRGMWGGDKVALGGLNVEEVTRPCVTHGVIPAKAGIPVPSRRRRSRMSRHERWIPAFAGMTP